MSTRTEARYKNDQQTAALRLLKQLRGEGANPYMNNRNAILQEATPAHQQKRQTHYEQCRDRFAKVCARVERLYGPFSSTSLDHMAQAVPDGVFMPIYFHNARWKYQFARNEMRQSSGDNPQVQQALASLRKEQAARLRRIRKAGKKNHDAVLGLSYDKAHVKRDGKLIGEFNSLRHSLRTQALQLMKQSHQPSNVFELPVNRAQARPQPTETARLA